MAMHDVSTLSLLSDSDLTIAETDEDIRGRIVKGKDGKALGTVDDMLIDEDDRRIRFMRVESGGFLGVGETKVFIPIDAITMITDVDVWIDQTHEHVARERHYAPHLVDKQKYFGDMQY
jgi:sporulation protein YlmC with PRC-barrel domain